MINPGYTLEARVGGLFLPFDVGFKAGYLPVNLAENLDFKTTLAGMDIRFPVTGENPALPVVSAGLGLNYLGQGLGFSCGDIRFSYNDPLSSTAKSITLRDPAAEFKWETIALDLKVQVSKSFFILTPYAGLGLSHGWSKAGYKVNAEILDADGNAPGGEAKESIGKYLEDEGVGGLVFTEQGLESFLNSRGTALRVFAGLSLNLAVFRLDLNGMCSLLDFNYGLSLGARFQL
jgi:hypothetical protein